jgi:N-dimethylarginine dimethylaminohydrolase
MVDPLRRVMVRSPRAADAAQWRTYGWHAQPDERRARQEHEALCAILEANGAEVLYGSSPVDGDPDAIYVCDPAIMSDRGAVLLRPGKEGRRREVPALAADMRAAGVHVAGGLEAPATAEGGDTLWLDDQTLLVGRSYRTNQEGIDALQALLPDIQVLAFDLPHHVGPAGVLHLMSLMSPLDHDLAVVFLPLMPVRLVRLLEERGFRLIPVPEEEFDSMGTNVLALAPRVGLALGGSPRTRRLMAEAGVEVLVYQGDEISRKGDGGPTCLTRSLLRARNSA